MKVADDILYITDHHREMVIPLKAEDILYVYIEVDYAPKGVIILYTSDGGLIRECVDSGPTSKLSDIIDCDTDEFFRKYGFTMYTGYEDGSDKADLLQYICFVKMDKILHCVFGEEKLVMIGTDRRTVSILVHDGILSWRITRDWRIKKRNSLIPFNRYGVNEP